MASARSPSKSNVVTTKEVKTGSCLVQDALRLEVLISPPSRYPPNLRVCSHPVSHAGDGAFRVRLIIVPNIPELVALLHIAPPEELKNSPWSCSNLLVTVSACKARDPEWKVSRSRVEKVCKDQPVTGADHRSLDSPPGHPGNSGLLTIR